MGAIPSKHTEECAALIESIFDIPCVRLPGFMALTLTPSNPILHTTRLKSIFSDYRPGVTYDSLPLFYEDWDNASSELLMACDDEIQDICRALPGFGLEYVVSERVFYNAETADEMTKAISSDESLFGLTTPSVKFYAYMTSQIQADVYFFSITQLSRMHLIELYGFAVFFEYDHLSGCFKRQSAPGPDASFT